MMRTRFLCALGSLALAAGCAGHTVDSDASAVQGSGGGGGGSASGGSGGGGSASGGSGGGVDGKVPYAACPDVFAGPVNDPGRDDAGNLGLSILREKVLASRDAWRRYSEAHGGTYQYNRQFDSAFGSLIDTTVHVTNGEVTSIAEISFAESGAGPEGAKPALNIDPASTVHPAVTMDALYDQCLSQILCQDPRQSRVYVQIDARGLLVECAYVPIGCVDDCYVGIEPLILTADGKDWTKPLPGCCAPEAAPACCMSYGGPTTGGTCGAACDGMPPPEHPGWGIRFDSSGCAQWYEPRPDSFHGCCGCPAPPDDGGKSMDVGTSDAGSPARDGG